MFEKRILSFIPFLFFMANFFSLVSIWIGDLFSHFRMFWVVFSIIFLIIYIILFNRKKVDFKVLISIFVSLFINLFSSYSFWTNPQTYEYLFFGSPTGVEYSEQVKQEIENDTTVKSLLLMNILSSNTNYEEVRRTIKNTDADFVVIIELNQKWENELKKIKTDYPYKFTEIREDNFGMGFYAKEKLFLEKKLSTSTPCIYFRNIKGKGFNIVMLHPIPPISKTAYEERNRYLDKVTTFSKQILHQKILLVGDLNCSPFSPDYKKFLKNSGLKDSQENFGFQPTWRSNLPFLMQTQLDHVWHSEDIEILHRQTLPIEGSDHKAVLVVFK